MILWPTIYSDTLESHFLPVGKVAASLRLLGPFWEKNREEEFGVDFFLGGGFKHFLFSPRTLWKIPILTNIFQLGWFNHQPVLVGPYFLEDVFKKPLTIYTWKISWYLFKFGISKLRRKISGEPCSTSGVYVYMIDDRYDKYLYIYIYTYVIFYT